MSDTPRTDEAQFGTERVSVSFARQLERELNAANERIKRLEEKVKDMESARTKAAANSLANMLAYEDATKKIASLEKENARLQAGGCARNQNTTQFCAVAVSLAEKVKRLEEAGNALAEIAGKFGHGLFVHERKDAWNKAKGQP